MCDGSNDPRYSLIPPSELPSCRAAACREWCPNESHRHQIPAEKRYRVGWNQGSFGLELIWGFLKMVDPQHQGLHCYNVFLSWSNLSLDDLKGPHGTPILPSIGNQHDVAFLGAVSKGDLWIDDQLSRLDAYLRAARPPTTSRISSTVLLPRFCHQLKTHRECPEQERDFKKPKHHDFPKLQLLGKFV